ncbi:methylenetetrahydrofolate--tRNA-(uracil(54)-C(5))-methyltransferase (FADH(2)-oxidizing) TrmFO [Candidatus Formimonas warabiya]|uniref:Methylenetetrahydrofolate--tRNA-(uracil-5-)-methyltransferase TrmFO n=1 Tax=Formimonas warabiya TaxID=1761012 RepID=A0A3G1KQ37_FORW1|nr:methylenetetrahydrofolate--tRNA-(uracil(54)-C(5))-methyltransferase (FADH(2)-oxidizing) TrmFO [Candidatus Formimonas warabiya]ATW24547.1 methylenetetrahydrofolate--tRNA-(uracil(54)-C(5))-methyltransferase (FADH(2)-oxidizing) TrmFO [Candidatus Formimonas warabiya]
MPEITIIGAGLAGAEAAWQAAKLGCLVHLFEMRPQKQTPAHHSGDFAELVCSNSLRADALENAVGLLKEEMRRMGSLIMNCADGHRVPAGGALAVDREGFAKSVTARLEHHPQVRVHREEVGEIPREGIVIVASGPLTAGDLAASIAGLLGTDYLYFHDAVAPIVTADSIDPKIVFRASRYGKGEDDYLNCPMTEEEYQLFYDALTAAEVHEQKEFEREIYFEGCMPVEAMAKRGRQTLAFGPMKPVGLTDPRTGVQPYAVVQLRQDNAAATLYNMVGFQTHLTWDEQRRVFRLIPGLEQAEFVRYGVMHRNTFINSPAVLEPTLQVKKKPRVFFAGQITGVEGYIESASNGLVAGINAARLALGKEPVVFPGETALGSLCRYIATAEAKHFQPMNITFGLMPPLEKRIRDKKEKNRRVAERALAKLDQFCADALR